MPTTEGWGIQPWGTSPWGGTVIPDQPQIGDFERLYREPRWKHEPPEIQNVLFKIEGVEAEARLGRPTCSTGYGTAARWRHALRIQCRVGAVGIESGTGTSVTAEAARAACECGAAEAGVSVQCEVGEGLVGNTDVGLAHVRAIRNPSDEEFLMMLAEML
jgi:hypothetical protein